MPYRAVIKSDGWWVGWLVDLPGVNAQERTREALIESPRVGAREMRATEVPLDAEGQLITIDVPLPCISFEYAEANATRAGG